MTEETNGAQSKRKGVSSQELQRARETAWQLAVEGEVRGRSRRKQTPAETQQALIMLAKITG